MFAYILRRLLMLPLVLLAVSVVIVGLMQTLSPEERAASYVSEQQAARPGVLEGVIERYGFDRPFYIQYGLWVKAALQGDLGYSEVSNEPVMTTIRKRLPASAELAIFSAIPILFIAIWLGSAAALNRDKFVDQFTRVLAILGWSLPTFVFGIWILAIFYGGFGWFGVGRVSSEYLVEINRGLIETPTRFYTIDSLVNGRFDMFIDVILHLILPVTTLVVVISAQIMRVMRSSLLDALSQDYVRTAKAKGLPRNVVNYKHARRNALIPVITLSGLMVAGLLNGTVVVETIFNYRGLGEWFATAAAQLDIPSVIGFALMTGIIIVVANLLVDLLYAAVDPRIRYD